MQFYGVVSDALDEAVELFTTREEAEAIVANWDRDDPARTGELHVQPVELNAGSSN
jgi:hypothetical protein